VSRVDPSTHEALAHLYYASVETGGEDTLVDYDGLDPYFALTKLLIAEYDGCAELQGVKINGELWDIRLNYHPSGIAPRPEDDIDVKRLYEIDINVTGHGERKCHFTVKPRFPEMRHYESGDRVTTPFHHTDPDSGVCVKCQSSNMALNKLVDLFPRFVSELAVNAGKGIYHGYFQAPFDGRLSAIERYARITRGMNEKLIKTGGVLDRMAMLLSDAEGTKGEYTWDNERERGYHHTVKHGSTGACELIQHHRLGGQVKSYLPENPENFEEGDAMYHPKVGTKFVKGRTSSGSVPWSDRHDVVRELDERLLSILSWADVPTQPGGTTYISDWHFDAEAADSPATVHEDPLPQLESQQEHLLMTVLRDMTPADQEFVETVATDGGMHVDELTEETGYSRSELYRALKRLPGLLESDNGHVQFTSEKLRQELLALIESVESGIKSAVDRAAKIVDMDLRQSASSAFDRWLAKYGAEVDWPDHDGEKPVVRIDTVLSEYKNTNSLPYCKPVFEEMISAWKTDGRDVADLLEATVHVNISGSQIERTLAILR